jgi:hypothetical protein
MINSKVRRVLTLAALASGIAAGGAGAAQADTLGDVSGTVNKLGSGAQAATDTASHLTDDTTKAGDNSATTQGGQPGGKQSGPLGLPSLL